MENPIFNSNIAAAVVGVIGTLLGTCLGWLLNELSQMGRLEIFFHSWEDKFIPQNPYAGLNSTMNKQEIEQYQFSGVIEIYNGSNAGKIMRNICVVFHQENNIDLFTRVPYDQALTKRDSMGFLIENHVESINIPPKSVVNLKISDSLNVTDGEESGLWNTTKMYLQYVDAGNKERRVLIRDKDFTKVLVECVEEHAKHE